MDRQPGSAWAWLTRESLQHSCETPPFKNPYLKCIPFYLKVLPDWRPKSSCKTGDSAASSVEALHRLEQFLSSRVEEEETEKAVRKEGSVQRKANSDFLLALDHMLYCGLGRGLKAFWCQQPPRGLVADELRYWLAGVNGRTRACVKNMTTGAKRFELPVIAGKDGVALRPALHVVTDEGCVGRVALLYLMSRTCLRGTALGDPLHRHWNDTKLAIKSSSLWSVVQEYTCVFNVHMAPWNQSAFHSIIAQAGREYFEHCDESNRLYVHMYEELAEERSTSPMEWATSEHYTALWRSLTQSKHLRSEGDHVKLGRWYSFFKEADARADRLAELQLILLYVGIQQGWWPDFESSPLGHRESLKEELLQREAPLSAGAGSSRTVSLSNEQEDLKQMRSSCRNTLEVVTRILGNTHRRRLLHCLRTAVAPFRECFQRLQTRIKTVRGRGETMVDWAAGTEICLVCST
eukprot:6472491-Amphidinium_carterae.3